MRVWLCPELAVGIPYAGGECFAQAAIKQQHIMRPALVAADMMHIVL
ncbi:hypothetical protein [uncultured Tessaracoccus sp.]|nr:hypothetical protein [uncultured Tessaracoccus sp.]